MTEGPPPSSRTRTVLRQVVFSAGMTTVALLLGASIPLYPLLRDDYRLDGIVRAVALDVRDFGVDKGQERLHFEIAAQGLSQRLRARDCTVAKGADGIEVACRWQVVLQVAWVDRSIPVGFSSHAHVAPDGDLDG